MKSFIATFAILSAMLLSAIAWGIHNQNTLDRVCGSTHNRYLCEQGLDMGDSEQAARDRGNVEG